MTLAAFSHVDGVTEANILEVHVVFSRHRLVGNGGVETGALTAGLWQFALVGYAGREGQREGGENEKFHGLSMKKLFTNASWEMSGILESVLWPAEIPAGLTGKGDGEQVEVRTGAEEFGINSRAVMEFISRDVFKSLWIVF